MESEDSSLKEEEEGGEEFNDTDVLSSCPTSSAYLSKDSLDSVVGAYVNLLNVDTSRQFSEFEELIDGLLAKLEEYCSIVESIRYESKDALFTTVPVLHERCEQLQSLFKQIDNIENFISIVSNCVSDAEMKVSKAEKELGNKNLKKILKNVPVPKFLAGKKEIQAYLKQEVKPYDYIPPTNFKTDDYFPSDHPTT